MIQRIQSIYMFLLALINIILIISIDSDPPSSISESYFGYYRIYITDYFFSEIISLIVLINIFLFKHSKTQMNILRTIALVLIFGFLNFIDERGEEVQGIRFLGFSYFLISFILIMLSIRYIKKDQAIISSSNRLR